MANETQKVENMILEYQNTEIYENSDAGDMSFIKTSSSKKIYILLEFGKAIKGIDKIDL